MVPFLLAKLWPFLKWYHFKPPFSSFPKSKGGLILGGLRGLHEKSPNGSFLLAYFSHFSKWYILLATKFSPIKPPGGYEKRQKGSLIFLGLGGLPTPQLTATLYKFGHNWPQLLLKLAATFVKIGRNSGGNFLKILFLLTLFLVSYIVVTW